MLNYKFEHVTTTSDCEIVINKLLLVSTYIAVDTETTGLDPHSALLSTVQLAVDKDTAYILDVFAIGKDFVKAKLELLFSNAKLIFHNFIFDCKIFWKLGIDLSNLCWTNRLFDTFIASSLLSSGLGYENKLGEVVSRYLGLDIDKSEQRSDWSIRPLTESQLNYAARDVIVLILLRKVLAEIIVESDQVKVFTLEMSIIPALASMEYNGIKVDIDRLTGVVREEVFNTTVSAEKAILNAVPNGYSRYDFLGNLVDPGLSVTSSSQILAALRSLEIRDPILETRTKQDPWIKSTGKNVIGLLDVVDFPILEALLQHRGAIKLLNTYVDGIPEKINPVTNRLHCSIKQMVSTGRMQASNPNLNSLPRPKSPLNVRSCFIPEDGNVLILNDFNQIELRVIAEVIFVTTGDKTMLQEFLDGKDPYANTAALLSGMTYEQFAALDKKEYKRRRQNAKAVRLGYSYAMQWKKFKSYAKITYGVEASDKEAKENRELYFSLYPGLQKYHDSFASKYILEVQTLPPFGRKRYWHEYPGIPSLCNLKIQGASADIQKLSIYYVYRDMWDKGYSPIRNRDVKLILTIHDELVLEATQEKAEYASELLNKYMPFAGSKVLKHCPVTAEAQIVNNLAEKD